MLSHPKSFCSLLSHNIAIEFSGSCKHHKPSNNNENYQVLPTLKVVFGTMINHIPQSKKDTNLAASFSLPPNLKSLQEKTHHAMINYPEAINI